LIHAWFKAKIAIRVKPKFQDQNSSEIPGAKLQIQNNYKFGYWELIILLDLELRILDL